MLLIIVIAEVLVKQLKTTKRRLKLRVLVAVVFSRGPEKLR